MKAMLMAASFCCGIFLMAQAKAAPFPGYTMVRLHNGVNEFTLAGRPATVVDAWRENFNAHGFDVASIYVDETARPHEVDRAFELVPVFLKDGKGDREAGDHEALEITAGGGADCRLHAFRLMTSRQHDKALLIMASREFGESYADSAAVHFEVYRLEENHDETPGGPRLSFVFDHRIESSKPYCDVDEAFAKELGLAQ